MTSWLIKNYQIKKNSAIFIIFVVMLAVFLIMLMASPPLIRSFFILFICMVLLFLPGFFLTFIFFPSLRYSKRNSELNFLNKYILDWDERMILSPFLSIAIIMLVLRTLLYLEISLVSLGALLIIIFVGVIDVIGALIAFWATNHRRNA